MIEKCSCYGWKPKSLIAEVSMKHLFDAMSGRVRVVWREQKQIELEDLADELVETEKRKIGFEFKEPKSRYGKKTGKRTG